MNYKLLFGFLIFAFLFIGSSYIFMTSKTNDKQEEKVYQGPVPLGYDLEHFRKTGETIKEVNE